MPIVGSTSYSYGLGGRAEGSERASVQCTGCLGRALESGDECDFVAKKLCQLLGRL